MSLSNDPTYPLFPVLSCIGFVLSIIPLPWHIQSWNSGTCAFMIWTALFCLVAFLNSIIWAGNVNNIAPVWCDISIQIIMGAGIGIPASTLCISRRLYKITTIRTVSITYADKRRAVIQDLCISLGIPILVLIMHIVVHPHRFDILEDIGCYPVTYNTLPAYFLYTCWPIVLGTISLVYSCLNLRTFYIRRAQFGQLVATTSAMNTGRYLRLMALACADILFTIPLASYVVYAGTNGVILNPWISWDDTHFDWWQVNLIPALFWRSNPRMQTGVELTRWLCVICSFLFFALFGFASEAQKHYRLAFWWVAKKLGFRRRNGNSAKWSIAQFKPFHKNTPDSLPTYSPTTQHKLKPLETFDITFGDLKLTDKSMSSPVSSPTTSCPPPTYTRTSISGSFVTLPDTEIRSSVHTLTNTPSEPFPRSPSPSLYHQTFDPNDCNDHSTLPTTSTPASYHLPFIPPSIYPTALSRGGIRNSTGTVQTEWGTGQRCT